MCDVKILLRNHSLRAVALKRRATCTAVYYDK